MEEVPDSQPPASAHSIKDLQANRRRSRPLTTAFLKKKPLNA